MLLDRASVAEEILQTVTLQVGVAFEPEDLAEMRTHETVAEMGTSVAVVVKKLLKENSGSTLLEIHLWTLK